MINGNIQLDSGALAVEKAPVANKTVFVESLQPGPAPIVMFALVVSCEVKATKRGAPYISAVLRDRTGEITARQWDSELPMERNGFVKVEGFVEEYNDELQLKLSRWRTAKAEEVRIEDFIPASLRDRDEMLDEIRNRIGSIVEPKLQIVTQTVVSNYREELRDAPAAKSNHQPYLGGLAEHILALCKLVDAVCGCYPALSRDLLISAAILHDIGKVKEYSYSLAIDYTRRGSLVGHVGMGLQMVRSAILEIYGDLDDPTFDELEHLIASHHGRLEWGALCEPLSREAHVFHFLDMIDSRCAKFDQCKETGIFFFNRERMYVPEPVDS